MPGMQNGFGHLVNRLGAKGVADVRSVKGDAGNAFRLMIADVFISLDCFPVRQLHQILGLDLRLLLGCCCHLDSLLLCLMLFNVF